MDELRREIKEALLGSLVPSDGRLVVSTNRWAKYRAGMQDGYDKVRIFGVMSRKRWYLSRKKAKQIRELAVKGMQNMGRMISLSSAPDLEAVYCSYLINNPAILTFQRNQDGTIELTAYSGRGFSGWLACFRTLNRFQKEVPEVLQRMSEEDEQLKKNELREERAENKRQFKQAKIERKQEKKLRRREKRKARLERMAGFLPSKLLSSPEAVVEIPATRKPSENDAHVMERDEREAARSFDGDYDERVTENVFASEYDERVTGNAFDSDYDEKQAESDFEVDDNEAMTENGFDADYEVTEPENDLDEMRKEQERLLAEAEQAELEAQAAQARLEAAQAKLAAKQAQAKLAEAEAKLRSQNKNTGNRKR